MSASIDQVLCNTCNKRSPVATCYGCDGRYCLPHFNEHRQQLTHRMDQIGQEHDVLKQDLTRNNKIHPLISHVNDWEQTSMERIQKVANQARSDVEKWVQQRKINLDKSIDSLTQELKLKRDEDTYTEKDLTRWSQQLQELSNQLEQPSTIDIENDQKQVPVYMIKVREKIVSQNSQKTKCSTNDKTVAGGHGQGDALNQLNHPYGLDIDDDGTLFIADTMNHRIMRWKPNATQGEIIIGGKGPGDRTDQLNQPVAVLIDRINRCLIVSDDNNRRVMRWSLDKNKPNGDKGEVIISNVRAFGLAMDTEGLLYISHSDKHEIRRHGPQDGRDGVVVAGGNGYGDGLHQLNGPRNIFVDNEYSVYVSDSSKNRLMKWARNAREGIVVAGGKGEGNDSRQLNYPSGVFVDLIGSVYVADQRNDRVMRWLKGATKGEVMVEGSKENQLNRPAGILVDSQGNLFVVDLNNDRIQRFDVA